MPESKSADEGMLLAEAQLVLAEKRTSLSTIRTGMAVMALPLSIVSVLVATSKMYDATSMTHLLVPLLSACVLLFLVGMYLLARAITRIRRHDRLLQAIRASNLRVAELIDS